MFRLTEQQGQALALLRGPQRNFLGVGGSRSGKTTLFCLCIMVRGLKSHGSRHGIFRFRANAVWSSIGLDTLPKIARAHSVPLKPNKNERYFTLPEHRVGSSFHRSEIWLGGLDDKERAEKVLGLEFVTIYENEASQIPYSSHLMLSTRLAQVCDGLSQRNYVDLNPSGAAHWTNQLFIKKVDPNNPSNTLSNPDDYAHFFLNPSSNADNLSEQYLATLKNMPERQRRRFWEGIYQDEIDNALWTLEMLDRARVDIAAEDVAKVARGEKLSRLMPAMQRVVVAIDPSGSSGDEDSRSDDIGIVVVGKGLDGRSYLLADRTVNAGPAVWARIAITAFHEFGADALVAERNFGGAMVHHTIVTAEGGRNVPYKEVVASKGKAVRAEPISVLYDKERDAARHAGAFPEIEEELMKFSTSGYMGTRSPNRADALIWGFAELFGINVNDGIIDFYRIENEARAEQKVKSEAPPDPANFVPLICPPGSTTAYGIMGDRYTADADGMIRVKPEDVKALRNAGFAEAGRNAPSAA